MIAFFLYGGMLLTILPRQPGVSFEAHAFGALGGVLDALWLRHRDPPPERPRYDWELEPDEDEVPLDSDASRIGSPWADGHDKD